MGVPFKYLINMAIIDLIKIRIQYQIKEHDSDFLLRNINKNCSLDRKIVAFKHQRKKRGVNLYKKIKFHMNTKKKRRLQ